MIEVFLRKENCNPSLPLLWEPHVDDIRRAVRLLRRSGVHVGMPLQSADGEMLFPVEDQTLTTKEILGLLERKELNHEGIRRLGAAKKKNQVS